MILVLLIPFSGISKGLDSLGFISPVDHVIKLTGNFMELRPNHFHAGIDIKSTNGQSGDRIKIVGDGYISRIKIQSGGYGNVLYIDHPNGYTSVYAHLSAFTDELEAYVKEIQYALESFEVDIYLRPSQFNYLKGEKIGEMGNTGRSFGPHLHFELRETKTEKPLNPEFFGIGPTDQRSPTLESLHLHQLSAEGYIVKKEIKYFNPKSKSYRLYQDTIEVETGFLGVGLQMFDRMDGSWNKNGVYGFELFVDGKLFMSWEADEFSFDETRYINAFWDYERKQLHGQKVYLMYRARCNPFSYYKEQAGDGIIDLKDSNSKRISIRAYDLYGNESVLNFVARSTNLSKPSAPSVLVCDTTYNHSAGYFDVHFGPNSFFYPTALDINYEVKSIDGQKCPSVIIGDRYIPVNGKYHIYCPLPISDPNKWSLIKVDANGKKRQFAADTIGKKLLARPDEIGVLSLYKDTIAPSIEPISFSPTLSTPWKLKITDNLIPDGRTNDLRFMAKLNGKWIRMKYDAKNDLLSFSDKDRLPKGPLNFKLIVIDHCGNVNRYERNI